MHIQEIAIFWDISQTAQSHTTFASQQEGPGFKFSGLKDADNINNDGFDLYMTL